MKKNKALLVFTINKKKKPQYKWITPGSCSAPSLLDRAYQRSQRNTGSQGKWPGVKDAALDSSMFRKIRFRGIKFICLVTFSKLENFIVR